MTNYTYLQSVLDAQVVGDDGQEMKNLRAARAEVEGLINIHFSGSSPTIRYGGSKAKGTMNLIDYDLDIICYFPRGDTPAGKTIEEIYGNVKAALEKKYSVVPRTTALRIRDSKRDLHIDVVPGRFIDDTKTYAFVHQNGGDKSWLQTNLDEHVDYIRDSGCVPEIRLAKLWRHCAGVSVRTFPLELLVIKILKSSNVAGLENRFMRVLEEFRDNSRGLSIKDPANEGNDLSGALNASVCAALWAAAAATLRTVANGGWEAVFDKVMASTETVRSAALRTAIVTNPSRTQPWGIK